MLYKNLVVPILKGAFTMANRKVLLTTEKNYTGTIKYLEQEFTIVPE